MDVLARLNAALSGRYDLEREIGAGGMATVYLARDVKHHRHVALKVMNAELGAVLGGDRFLSEIRVTANLQHPNLLPLFDSGDADGLLFYVMPYIEGQNLRARLEREKQLPVHDALRIATAVASALDYAHRHGVIHRDLKPENILLQDGQPVVADFGIALAVAHAGGERLTQSGLSLGTPHYMSPEQAAGDRSIDGRTDIYSLGAVLYEMLVGDPPHTASTAQALIAKLLTEEPRAVRAGRSSVPPPVERALHRALAKLPADRWATAREFAQALESGYTEQALAPEAVDATMPLLAARHAGAPIMGSTTQREPDAPAAHSNRWRAAAPWGLAALGTVVVVALAVQAARPTNSPAQRVHFALTLADSAGLRTDGAGAALALSPDGSQLAYVGGNTPRIFIRPLDDLHAHPVAGTENGSSPQFSPDGKWLAFIAGGHLKKMPIGGGPAVTIVDDVLAYSWGDGDIIVFTHPVGPNAGLWRVSADGGAAERLTTLDASRVEVLHSGPFVLPGGKAVAFNASYGTSELDSLEVLRLDDHSVIRLGVQGTNPRYAPSGHLLVGRQDGTIIAVPFDAKRLKVLGQPVPVLENVAVSSTAAYGAVNFALSANGTLVYAPARTGSELVLVDGHSPAKILLSATQSYLDMRLSPDCRRLAVTIQSGGARDVWIVDVATHTLTRLTSDGTSDRPSWTTDGRRIAWRTKGKRASFDIMWAPADASGGATPLVEDAWSAVFAPSAKFIVVNTIHGTNASEIDVVTADSAHVRTPFGIGPQSGNAQRISPDGAWLAFSSNQSGRAEVYVRALSGASGMHQISADGGTEPIWSPSGKALFFRTPGGKLMSATIATTPAFAVVRRDTLLDDVFRTGGFYSNYDVSPDGRTFVMARASGAPEPPVVMLGWLDELRERMRLSARK